MPSASIPAVSGSSPHKWGILQILVKSPKSFRFIPTQVGNTTALMYPSRLISVHPHTSGEYLRSTTKPGTIFGSSPHKWGIRLSIFIRISDERFIPTQVGNTPCTHQPTTASSVHPHTSGEYASWKYLFASSDGSSPHKWGIPVVPSG